MPEVITPICTAAGDYEYDEKFRGSPLHTWVAAVHEQFCNSLFIPHKELHPGSFNFDCYATSIGHVFDMTELRPGGVFTVDDVAAMLFQVWKDVYKHWSTKMPWTAITKGYQAPVRPMVTPEREAAAGVVVFNQLETKEKDHYRLLAMVVIRICGIWLCTDFS